MHKGTSVILCEHSNSERRFLNDVLRAKVQELAGKDVKVVVSEADKDPLVVV